MAIIPLKAQILEIHQWRNKQIDIVVLCPYCGKKHSHGGGYDISRVIGMFGHRSSHCVTRKPGIMQEQYDAGYEIAE